MNEPQISKQIEKLFLYLFEQGFMTEEQIEKATGLNHGDILQLLEEGYLDTERSYFDHCKLYFPTKRAYFFLKNHGVKVFVGYLTRPPIKNDLHDRRLTDIRILFDEMGYSHWQSEKCLNQRGMKEVRPDAILSIQRRKIAIELEFTGKSEHRYQKRFQFYAEHPAIDAVIYFIATPELREKIIQISKDHSKIYSVLLKNTAEHKQNAHVESTKFQEPIPLWKFLTMFRKEKYFNHE